jgi:hypothetical protein
MAGKSRARGGKTGTKRTSTKAKRGGKKDRRFKRNKK